MMMPKRVKFRKSQRGTMKGPATRGNRVSFGDFGLMALEQGWLSAKEIEAGRVAAAHAMGTEGRLYIRVFPHKSISAKPAEVRMGQGKGPVEFYVAVIKPGAVLFELAGVSASIAKEAFRLVEQSQAYQGEEVASYLFHAYGTNLQFAPGEFNFVKTRAQHGTKEAFRLRDEHFYVPEP